jgi:hypothetical protein
MHKLSLSLPDKFGLISISHQTVALRADSTYQHGCAMGLHNNSHYLKHRPHVLTPSCLPAPSLLECLASGPSTFHNMYATCSGRYWCGLVIDRNAKVSADAPDGNLACA